MRLSNATILSVALSAALFASADPACELTLDRSMALTDSCLKELAVYKAGGNPAEGRIVEQLRAENAALSIENKSLREKINASANKSAVVKHKKHNNGDGKKYKRYGKQLAAQYKGVSDVNLLKQGLYRVQTLMINVRDTPGENGDITAVANKGEVYPFSSVVSKTDGSKETVYWLKGDMGYMYVTNSNNPDIENIVKKRAKPADNKTAKPLPPPNSGKGGGKN